MHLPLRFSARHVSGSSRGRTLGTPTLNLDLTQVPAELAHGIYACRVTLTTIDSQDVYWAVMHYGPRPVFEDTESCEIHVLDKTILEQPDTVDVEVVALLRGPETFRFPSPEAMLAQIERDIAKARAILGGA
jgi:riboflavin kinase/FMN adenylyltransferase